MKMRVGRALGSLAILSLAACAVFGGSDGNEPPKGSVDRRYSKSPDEISRAAIEVLGDLQMTVQKDEHDALGGQITAERSSHAKETITVWYKSADARNTQVSVAVGKGDRALALLIQDQIAQKLGAASARATPAVGANAEAEYDLPLAQCLTAAERAMKALKLDVSHKERHDTWAQVESRQADALPVTVRMDRTDKDKTKVYFTAGTSKSQDTQQIADRLQAEFERILSTAK